MSERGDWIATLQSIIRRMEASDVTELDLRQGGLRLRLRRGVGDFVAVPRSEGTRREAPSSGKQTTDSHHKVQAPLTGIYYSAANPTSPPYVSVGDWVEPETVVGLVETMKVFNEMTADCRGRVASIIVEHGQLVHAGETVILVDTAARPDSTREEAE